MTTQQTSIDALIEERLSGRIGKRQAEVMRAVIEYGPGTSAEILRAANLDANRNLMRARFTELADAGRIVQLESRSCAITGRNAIVWGVAWARPEPRQKSGHRSMRAIRQIQEFRAWALREIAHMDQIALAIPHVASIVDSQRRKIEAALSFFPLEVKR